MSELKKAGEGWIVSQGLAETGNWEEICIVMWISGCTRAVGAEDKAAVVRD